jgi:hypothetical protein
LPNCSYDVIIYDAVHQNIIDVTQRNLDRWLMLCLMNEDHYDVVYKKEHIQNAGFCQCNEMYLFFLYYLFMFLQLLFITYCMKAFLIYQKYKILCTVCYMKKNL